MPLPVLGIIGGGQLGSLLADAAKKIEIKTVILSNDINAPAKNFSDKQIIVEKKHIDYIIKRIDRSYEKISHFILTLDKYSLKKGTPFSLKLIKEVLKMI